MRCTTRRQKETRRRGRVRRGGEGGRRVEAVFVAVADEDDTVVGAMVLTLKIVGAKPGTGAGAGPAGTVVVVATLG